MPRRLSCKVSGLKPSATMQLSSMAKEMQAKGIDVLSFAVGEPDFPTPPHIVEAAKRALDEGKTKYTPAAGIPELREAIVRAVQRDMGLDYEPKQVVVSNGAKHALMNVWECILEPGDEVVVIAPCWVSYEPQIEIAGGRAVLVPTRAEDDFQPDLDEVKKAVGRHTAAILINSPCNPTGAVLQRETLEGIAQIALDADCWIVSDEVYRFIIFDGQEHFSPAMVSEEVRERTILIDAASKTYSMTGWRIGWMIAPRQVADAAAKLQSQQTSNPNTIAQWAAVAALEGPQDCVAEMTAEFQRRRDFIYEAVSQIPQVVVSKPRGAFYIFPDVSAYLDGRLTWKGEPITDDETLCFYLLEEAHISVVPGTPFGAPGYIRLSFATSMEAIEEGLARLRAGLGLE